MLGAGLPGPEMAPTRACVCVIGTRFCTHRYRSRKAEAVDAFTVRRCMPAAALQTSTPYRSRAREFKRLRSHPLACARVHVYHGHVRTAFHRGRGALNSTPRSRATWPAAEAARGERWRGTGEPRDARVTDVGVVDTCAAPNPGGRGHRCARRGVCEEPAVVAEASGSLKLPWVCS